MEIKSIIENGAVVENNYGFEDYRAESIFESGGVEAEKLAEMGQMLRLKLIEFFEKIGVDGSNYLFCFEVNNAIRIVRDGSLDIKLMINPEQNDMFDMVRLELGSNNGGLVMDYHNISYQNGVIFQLIADVIKSGQ